MSTQDLIERLKQEAQAHAQEARTANATIAEIYRIVSGGTGEPGNWHGAEPVRKCVEELREQVAALTPIASHAGAEPDKWIFDPHDIEQGMMLNPEWLKLHGLTAKQAAAPSAAIAAREQEATLAQLLQVAQIDVNEVRADGKPLTRADRFAARMSSNREGLTTEWRITFNTDYGLHESEDDLCAAILSAIKARHESTS